MRNLLVAIDEKNDLDIPQDDLARLKSDIHRGSIAQLSPDREAVPFMLFALGSDFATIASQTSVPLSIIYATAIYYDWSGKLKSIREKSKDFRPEDMLSDIYNLSLVIIKHGITELAREVMSGEKKVSQFPLFPKNLHGFEKLFTVLEKLKEFSGEINKNPGTFVTAQNVQINQGINNEDIVITQEDDAIRKERELKYKMLRGETI